MKKNQIEEKKESALITDEEGLTRVSSLLNKHNVLFIEYPHIEIPLQTRSIIKMCEMAGVLAEEYILFALRVHNDKVIYEEEDSFLQSYRNKPKPKSNFVIDTEDVILDSKSKDGDQNNYGVNTNHDNYDNLINQNTLANSNDIEQNIINSMKNKSFFERNITFFLVLWESSYLGLLLCGVIYFCHMSFFIFHSNSYISFYFFIGVLINILLFISGFLGLYHIKIKKTQKINETNVNLFLFSLVALTLVNFIYVEYVMDQSLQMYLLENSFFIVIYITLFTNEITCLIINFKMNQFYVEYNFLLPLKYPLISDRVVDFIDDRD